VPGSPCGQSGTRFEALAPLRQGIREYIGAYTLVDRLIRLQSRRGWDEAEVHGRAGVMRPLAFMKLSAVWQ